MSRTDCGKRRIAGVSQPNTVESRENYVKRLSEMKGYALYKQIYKKYWYRRWKKREDKEILEDLGICLAGGMDAYLLGLCIIIMSLENDTIYNTKWQVLIDDAAGRLPKSIIR